jgi:hypothetical protein
LIGGLNPEVARRYGYTVDSDELGMTFRLQAAISTRDWQAVMETAQQLLDRKSYLTANNALNASA